jgi:hypothetical protein
MRAKLPSAAAATLLFGSLAFAQDAAKTAPQKLPNLIAPPASAADAKQPSPPVQSADSAKLAAADVRNWKGFAKRLEVMGEADLLPTSAVWKAFSSEAKAATKRIAASATPATADQRTVLDGVNAWITGKTDASLTAENFRDPAISALLKKADPSTSDVHRLHRLIVDSMFPFELAQPVMVADGNVSRYPPNHMPEVTLSLKVPNLRGRLKMFLPNQETLVFSGEAPLTIKVPNDGKLRFAIPGDEYDEPFPRTVEWTDDQVKNGVVERTLPLLKGRRKP